MNSACYKECDDIQETNPDVVKGYDFNKGLNYDAVFASYKNTGF
jgi:hypothetical protein